jgi:mannose-1-phosphate guanylyltransferase
VIAVVLVGGEGTRLRPLTLDLPKPVLPIGGIPFTSLLVDRLVAAGVTRVILSCGYLPDVLRAEFGSVPPGVDVEVVVEDEPLGTAGAIRFAAEGRVDGPFLALNGDILGDADLAALLRTLDETGAAAAIGLTPVDDPTRFGVVIHDRDGGPVQAFVEKPPSAEGLGPAPYWVNAGAYALRPEVLDLIEPGRMVSIEREVFPLLTDGRLVARRDSGYWLDLGTLETFLSGNADALAGVVRTRLDGSPDLLDVDPGARIDPTAHLTAPVRVGSRAVVEAGALVGPNVVVGDGATVGRNARVRDTVLFDHAVIGADAEVRGSVLARRSAVGERTRIRGCVVGTERAIASGTDAVDQRIPGEGEV